jgi:hypothetical protein
MCIYVYTHIYTYGGVSGTSRTVSLRVSLAGSSNTAAEGSGQKIRVEFSGGIGRGLVSEGIGRGLVSGGIGRGSVSEGIDRGLVSGGIGRGLVSEGICRGLVSCGTPLLSTQVAYRMSWGFGRALV